MGKISINTELMYSKIDALIEEKKKIDEVLTNFKGDSLDIANYWSGDTGEMVSDSLKEYSNEFDYISNSLQTYIIFLKSVCEAYEFEEESINKQIESNGNISM